MNSKFVFPFGKYDSRSLYSLKLVVVGNQQFHNINGIFYTLMYTIIVAHDIWTKKNWNFLPLSSPRGSEIISILTKIKFDAHFDMVLEQNDNRYKNRPSEQKIDIGRRLCTHRDEA